MYSREELTAKEKNLKKKLREFGGICEVFPDVKTAYQAQIDTIKKILEEEKTIEQNKSSKFGKSAKLRKEAEAKISELSEELKNLEEKCKNLDELTKYEVPPSKEQHQNLEKLVNEFKTNEILSLSFDEIVSCFSIGIKKITELNSAQPKDDALIEKYNAQQKEIHKSFMETLKSMDEYFLVFSPATRLPYMDFREQTGMASMWLFTSEDYAKHCRNFFARQYIFLDVVKISKEHFAEFSKNLPRYGYNTFMLNNGVHNLTIDLSALIGKVQYSCPINPMLHTRRIDFFQSILLYDKVPQTNHKLYEQYHNPMVMRAKESVMMHEMSKAQYTLVSKPVKQKNENGEEFDATEIPTNMKNDVRFLLVFTDMLEFNAWKKTSGFPTENSEFKASIVGFDVIDKLAADTGSELLIDRNGWCLELTKEKRETVKKIAEQVKKLEEEKKSQGH